MRKDYVLFGLTDEDIKEIQSMYHGRRIAYVYGHFGYMYALIMLSDSEYRAVKRQCRIINILKNRNLTLFTKEEFGAA